MLAMGTSKHARCAWKKTRGMSASSAAAMAPARRL